MQDDYSDLDRFLGDASRPAETFTLHELQGFLFAIASSPETVPPSEWLPMIDNDESLKYADEAEAGKIFGLVMNLYNEINLAVLERRNALPRGCAFHDDLWANFNDDASISQWSTSGMSRPCSLAYCKCSIDLTLCCCFSQST